MMTKIIQQYHENGCNVVRMIYTQGLCSTKFFVSFFIIHRCIMCQLLVVDHHIMVLIIHKLSTLLVAPHWISPTRNEEHEKIGCS